MFGKLRPILEAVPNYIVDYQERPPEASADSDRRWIDRITTDGSWSGNLYDFYKLTIQRITRDLKVPFRLKGTTRVDDTPVHEAMREALTNLLIHADFTGRVSLYVVKRQDMVGFRNPGLMRVPIRLAIKGGQSDCRNRNLQKMFQLVGLAEQAGSGLSKVFRNWKRQHWRKPELLERIAPDQTILRLRMVSILPEGTSEELEKRCGGPKFLQLKETARMALATVLIEGNVSHARLKSVTTDHPKDVSKTLASLVEDGLLVSRGATRGTVYYFPDEIPTDHEAEDDLEILSAGAAGKLGDSSKQVELSSQHSPGSSQQSIEGAYEEVLLRRVSENVRTARKSPKEIVRKTIISLCSGRFLTAQKLASLLDREMLSLQNHYLRHMIKSGQLRLQFPESPTHPKQAYTSASDSAL
jgi:ATP-dependent DNA helicase RecG